MPGHDRLTKMGRPESSYWHSRNVSRGWAQPLPEGLTGQKQPGAARSCCEPQGAASSQVMLLFLQA